MKKLILICIMLCMVVPCFAVEDKPVYTKSETTAKVIIGCVGAWGIATFAASGGLYPLATGTFCIYSALKNNKDE